MFGEYSSSVKDIMRAVPLNFYLITYNGVSSFVLSAVPVLCMNAGAVRAWAESLHPHSPGATKGLRRFL